MSVHLTHWPPTHAMVDLEAAQVLCVLRKLQTGTDELGTPLFGWQEIARLPGAIHPKSGLLRMLAPGQMAWSSHTLLVDYALDADGGLIVRPRDIVVDEAGTPYLVRFVIDEGNAHVQLVGDLESGTLNSLQSLAEQG